MGLRVLSVAYPFAPVGADAVGGAEQVLHAIDRRLVAAGHRSIVIACEGSAVAGELIAMPMPHDALDTGVHAEATRQYRRTVEQVLAHRSIDVVHLHGLDFDRHLPPPGVPVLATVHLPPELLLARLDAIARPDTWIHGVSHTQQQRLANVPHLLPPIENGVAIDELGRSVRRRRFVAALGRICPEKGFHLALDAARRARTPILIGGMVFPYPQHQRYFERELVPRLGPDRRFVGPLAMRPKRRLLNAARCLLVPSQTPETSSLVAMEAMACGTPVIAFSSGALADIVEDGVTGFLVRDVQEMTAAMAVVDRLCAERISRVAARRFSADAMLARYLAVYESLARKGRNHAA
jgi:glycosyltransferase involved in cell wall biosynthesis